MVVQVLSDTGGLGFGLGFFDSSTLSLMLFYSGISIVTLLFMFFLFGRLKGQERTRHQTVRLNCWFCCQDVDVKWEERESWTCPDCDQYNGFTKNGDYIQPVKEQFDVKDYKTRTACSPSEFVTAKSILCESCSQNQLLKVRQLAAFTPFCEASYDEELDLYNDYLENRYSLCNLCRQHVSEYLHLQDQRLAGTMKEEHLLLLDQLNKKDRDVRDCAHVHQARPRRPTLPFLMFIFCMCAAIVRVTLGLAYCSAALLYKSDNLPNWLLAWAEQACHYLGAVSCAAGLFIAGKNSLYPEDAGHLLLWLMLIVTTSDLPTSAAAWLNLTRERVLFVDAATVLLSAICCWRKRVPRHWTAASISKKQISHPETQLRDSQKMDKRCEQAVCSTPSLPSTELTHTSGDGTSQFEHVQQDLESLSLGLARKSGSTTSIWSLPAIVSTSICDIIPDSTTDNSTQIIRQSRSILSPSRLGFLNMDSILRDPQSQSSSSSPTLLPNGSDSLLTHISSDNKNQDLTPTLHSFSSGLPKPVQLSPAASQPFVSSKSMYKSAFRSPKSLLNPPALFHDSGPCDSQTPDSLLQIPKAMNQLKSHHSIGGTLENTTLPWGSHHSIGGTLENTTLPWGSQHKSGQMCMFMSHAIDTFKMVTPGESRDLGYSIAPRRSQRTLVTGKLPKPWPLKKSLSCGNLGGQEVHYAMGSWRHANLAAPKHKFRQNVVDQSNSALNSHLTPDQEASSSGLLGHTAVGHASSALIGHTAVDHASSALIGHTAVGHACNDRTIKRNLPARTLDHSIPEFSDDECEVDTSGQPSFQESNTSMSKQRRNDVSWQWLLVGTVMGASLACNIFLTWQSWSLAQAD